MKPLLKKRVLLASAIAFSVTCTFSAAPHLHAANWTGTSGGTGSWGVFGTTAPTPGWDDLAGFPNAQGAVAQIISPIDTANAVTTQDTGVAVTVGTINYGNNNDMGDFSWTITNTNGITLDQDGGGIGSATISNSSTNTGVNNSLIISGAGSLSLNDDLRIVNTTTGSTALNGAIQIGSVISGTGNITINNSQLIDPAPTTTSALGAVRLTGANTFSGTTTIEKGLVVFNTIAAFGNNGANTITLGAAGANDVTLAYQGTAAVAAPGMTNPIVVAGGNTGTVTFGILKTTQTGGINYSGSITLNGNLNILSNATAANAANGLVLNGIISGVGGITKVGPGAINIFGDNDYHGDTIVTGGTIAASGVVGGDAIPNGPGYGNVQLLGTGTTLLIGVNETINGLSGTGRISASNGGSSSRTLTVGDNNATSTFEGSFYEISARRTNLTKIGSGTLTLSGANTNDGFTRVDGGTLQFAKRTSYYNGNAAALPNLVAGAGWTLTKTQVNTGGTIAFNVGGVDEFTDADIALIQAIDSAAATNSGFGDGSSIGLDTTNAAGGEFVYNNPITNTFDGANSIGLKKLGANTLTLTATSTYTGNTTVAAGTLNITGNHATGANYSVATGANLITNNVRVSNSLSVDGTATINTNGGTAGASKVETLAIGGSGKLNLKDNDLVVGTAANVDAVRTAIVAGKVNNAATGITSDVAAFGTTTGFGYAMGNDTAISPLLAGSLSGQSYDADSVLVKYTFLGDADLDGDSDLNDLGLWAQAFTGDLGNPANPATYWTSGDFDYDGDTDLNDLGFWAGTFTGDLGGGAGSLIVVAPGAPAGAVAALNSMGITVVPEPSTFVLAGVGLAGLAIASRRKRSKTQTQ